MKARQAIPKRPHWGRESVLMVKELWPIPLVSIAKMTQHKTILGAVTALLGLLAFGDAALAQSRTCQRLQAELASLGRGSSQAASAAQRQAAEISRMVGYYRNIGCERGGFLFFGGAPPECGSIAERIRGMEANYRALASQASPYGLAEREARRQQLQVAIAQSCRSDEADTQTASIGDAQTPRDREDRKRPIGGGRMVCVRACDGYFFPLNNMPKGRKDADDLCQALCPNSETAAYRMPTDGDIEQAISLTGKPYTRLQNASLFKKAVNPTCSCKKEGETWAKALLRAEAMLDGQKSDIIVTAKKAEELSRPKIALAASRGKQARKGKEVPASDVPDISAIDPEVTGSVRTGAALNANVADRKSGIRTVRTVGEGVIPVPARVSQ